ncbi:MAG: GNAT family N-acetyltransferase [Anaerobacillus sp.]
MKLRVFNDPIEYLNHVQSFLELHGAVNNLSLGILHRLVRQYQNEEWKKDFFLGIIESASEDVLLSLIQTPPHNLAIAGRGNTSDEVLRFAAEQIRIETTIPGVLGEKHLVDIFSKEFCRLTDQKRKIHMNQRIYKLNKVQSPKSVRGNMRKATIEDTHLITEWIQKFTEVLGQPSTKEESLERSMQFIEEKTLALWEVDGKVVSMANETRPTAKGMTINFVYTPPQFEKNGYASACVAELSQSILDRGYSFCSLYTDLSNPTSNSIYMKIGYKPVGDSTVYIFERS